MYIYLYTQYKYNMGLTPLGSLFFKSCFESSSRGLFLGTEAPVRTLDSVDSSFFLSIIMQLYVNRGEVVAIGTISPLILKVSSTLGRKGIEAHMTRQLGTSAHPKECIMPVACTAAMVASVQC